MVAIHTHNQLYDRIALLEAENARLASFVCKFVEHFDYCKGQHDVSEWIADAKRALAPSPSAQAANGGPGDDVVTVNAEEFARIEETIRNPASPTKTILEGADMLHILQPKLTKGDEELWLAHVDEAYHGDWNDPDTVMITKAEFLTALAAVRQEAEAATQEWCAKVAEGPDAIRLGIRTNIAADIRASKPPA